MRMRLDDLAEGTDPITGDRESVFDLEAWIKRILGVAMFLAGLALGKGLITAVSGLFGRATTTFGLGRILPGLGAAHTSGTPAAPAASAPNFLGGA